jgi:multicomponent Na+:H+ antiporter subunit F
MKEIFLVLTMAFLVLAMIISVIRLIIGPTVWDRLLSLNLISAKIIMLLAVYAVYERNLFLLDIAFSYGLIGFLTLILLSHFIARGGRYK